MGRGGGRQEGWAHKGAGRGTLPMHVAHPSSLFLISSLICIESRSPGTFLQREVVLGDRKGRVSGGAESAGQDAAAMEHGPRGHTRSCPSDSRVCKCLPLGVNVT